MKLLFVSEFFPPDIKGGGEISCYLLAKNLIKENKNLEIHVLTSKSTNKKLKEYEEIEKIKIHRILTTGDSNSIIGNLKRLKFKKSLLENLKNLDKKENFDLIHCFNITSIYAVLLKKIIKKPFILHVNSPVLFCPKGTLIYQDKEECNLECGLKNYTLCYLKSRNLGKIRLSPLLKYNPIIFLYIRNRYQQYKKIIKKFDYYVAISQYMKDRLIKLDIPEKKIVVIYNILEMDKKKKEENNEENNENKKNIRSKSKNKIKKILYLGPYTEPKGCKILFDVLKKINLVYEANFYGQGTLKNYLIKNANEKIKINEQIPYSFVPEIIEKTDILIIPSIVAEGFSRAAYEGISLNKIVIANKIGGINDIIIDGKTGFLYKNETELKVLIEKGILNKLKIDKKELQKHSKKLKNYKDLIKIYKTIIKKYKKV